MQLGNGRWESTVFNSRLQPVQIALGSTGTGAQAHDLLKLDYGYGGANNNGNVLSQTITVKRPSQPDLVFDQLYTYDSFNRISSAEEKTGTMVNWNQTYTFDRYGNRNFNESLTTTLPKGCMDGSTPVVCEADKKILNPALDPANNKMASGQGWSYDAAGNVIGDPQGRSFIYDAENKQVEVENSLEQSIGKYWFDGDGKRIKKEGIAPNGQPELTVFVYDAGGKLIGEYSTNIETAAPKVQYLTADHLGSPRINTDQNGTVTSRTDYMPYGEEIIALGGRAIPDNYVDSTARQGFTGYENDFETGLDFAQARMYSKNLARFTGVDAFGPWAMSNEEKIEFLTLPQRWNRFSYVTGNPLKFTDPTGLYVCGNTVSEDQCSQIDKGLKALRDKGTDEQRKFATWLLEDENKTVFEIGKKASVGISDSEGANKLIQKGNVTINQASEFITITLDEKGDFSTNEGFSGTEPVLAHEGRHAWVAAHLITAFSNGSASEDISHYENEFQAHYSAALYLRKQGGDYVDWGINKLGHLKTVNGKITVNAQAIREKLASPAYNLTKDKPGPKTSTMYGLVMRKK